LERRAVAADDTNPTPVSIEARPVRRPRKGVLEDERRDVDNERISVDGSS
jgi:hypothetical protein